MGELKATASLLAMEAVGVNLGGVLKWGIKAPGCEKQDMDFPLNDSYQPKYCILGWNCREEVLWHLYTVSDSQRSFPVSPAQGCNLESEVIFKCLGHRYWPVQLLNCVLGNKL